MGNIDETKEMMEVTKIIKIISESIREHFEGLESHEKPDRDSSLIAMQVLSILCGFSRGYSNYDMHALWEHSLELSKRVHSSRQAEKDKVDSKIQDTFLVTSQPNLKN